MGNRIRGAKKRRAKARQRRGWTAALPWLVVAGLGAGIVVALFVVSVGGGGSGNAETSYPPGYTPPTLGDPSAPVELVMWEDFQCPFCQRFTRTTLPELERSFVDTGQVRIVWRNFQRYGSESFDAGVAAYCAGEQGKFWEYGSELYEHLQGIQSGTFTAPNLQRFAQDLGLDMTAFNQCFNSRADRYLNIMAADRALARDQGVNGTPTFFINGQQVVGAQPTDTFASIIEDALSRAAE